MRLGIVSDTHGELDNLRRVARELAERWEADAVVHLGDECEDAEELKRFPFKDIFQVPGIYCEHYQDPAISNRIIKNIEGFLFLFTHSSQAHANDLPCDSDPQELAARKQVDVICYGHTHIPEIRKQDAVIWLNPGHLKSADKKGCPPSFAIADIEKNHVVIYLVDLQSSRILQKEELMKA